MQPSRVGVREGTQEWTDAQMVTALMMLNLAGGESVDDLRLLEKDEGLGRALLTAETHGMRRAQRRAQRRRWRKERSRLVPSSTAVFRYLDRFHDEAEEARRRSVQCVHTGVQRRAERAWESQRGVGGVRGRPLWTHTQATLDIDATLIGTHKRQACYCYKKHKAYQPLTTYWHEADLVVHSEFRDGQQPAPYWIRGACGLRTAEGVEGVTGVFALRREQEPAPYSIRGDRDGDESRVAWG